MAKDSDMNQTIDVYRKLGKQYIKSIENLTPPEFYEFIKFVSKGGLVLEVGCAGGRECRKFVDNGFKAVGVDLVDEFLAEAKRLVPEAQFLKMDVGNLKFPESHFDAIWANAILLHIKKKKIPHILQDFYRILKPEGKLFIGVKEGEGEEIIIDKLSGGLKRFFAYFTEKELREFLEKAGFKIIFLKNYPDDAGRSDVRWLRAAAAKK